MGGVYSIRAAANPSVGRILRVDYDLPSAGLAVSGSGVPFAATLAAASAHRLVWVDPDLP